MLTYSSPKHFVVCHVLLHLLMPRHPPYALIHLITIFLNYPNLMRFYYFKILSICFFLVKKNISHIIQFSKNYLKELHILSKLSKTFKTIAQSFSSVFLHRKEVIHPHVLVGIPCYDFTPITCPTLNGPLLKG